MAALYEIDCTRPKKGEGLDAPEIKAYAEQVPGWKVIHVDGEPRLQREFKFKNFSEALQFTNQVGNLADAQDHHPAILTEWGKVTVTFWTHATGGLHVNDFIMAAKTDRL
jgi:4a-hydroxytetrahydrobiopterin dehydratase